ncbi:MAG: DUF6443 domain-containing protein [Chitinophagaceae bacterium]
MVRKIMFSIVDDLNNKRIQAKASMIKDKVTLPGGRKIFVIAIAVLSAWNAAAQLQVNKPGTATQSPASKGTVAGLPTQTTPTTINYIRTWEAMGRYTDINTFQSDAAATNGYQNIREATQYFDGLGRPVQTVSRQASPGTSPKDLVAPVVYDAFGREQFKYLPYVQSSGATNTGAYKTAPFTDQDNFYKTVYKDESGALMYAGETALYSRTEFEPSPLNRVTKTFAPGNSWAGSYNPSDIASEKSVEQKYLTNTTDDKVKVWGITSNALTYSGDDAGTNIPALNSTLPEYAAGTLYKTVTIDEQKNAVVEYKDIEGKVILKKVQSGTIPTNYSGYTGFLCTYYIYDDLGQLRFVIPPKAVTWLLSHSWSFSQTGGTTEVIPELCFRYEYDYRQRMIAKKVPGAGWVYMIYDARDRLVLTQDANLRSKNQWMVTLYDALNRPVMTGMANYSGNAGTLQTAVTSQTTTTSTSTAGLPADKELSGMTVNGQVEQALKSITMISEFETPDKTEFTAEIVSATGGADEETTVVDGMVINKNPLSSLTNFVALTKTYYDDYERASKTFTTTYNASLDAGSNLHAETMPSDYSRQVKGMITVSKVRTIENPADLTAGAWLTTVNYYDDRGRVVQSQADNYRGGNDIVTNRYDFVGKVISSVIAHNNPSATAVKVKTNYEYDFAGRLQETWKTINDDAAKKTLIAKNSYDELGQLKSKKLGQVKDANGLPQSNTQLETLSYTYNIRGWLKGINRYYANKSSSTETEPALRYGIKL